MIDNNKKKTLGFLKHNNFQVGIMRREHYRRRSNAGRTRNEISRVQPIQQAQRNPSYEFFALERTITAGFNFEAVAGDGGAISVLLLNCPQDFLSFPAYREVVSGILRAMSPHTHFIICADHGNEFVKAKITSIVDTLNNAAERVHKVDTKQLDLTPFVQDVCLCQKGQNGRADNAILFLEPSEYPRLEDAIICDRIGDTLGHTVKSSNLLFQGGNLLITGRHLLIGRDHFEANLGAPGSAPTPADLSTAFETLIDERKKLVVLGGTPISVPSPVFRTVDNRIKVHYLHHQTLGLTQPLFHIDMFVTPLGLVNGKETVVVGQPVPSSTDHGFMDFLSHLPFDETVFQLMQQGYHVERLPITTGLEGTKGDKVKVREINQPNETARLLRQSLLNGGSEPTDSVELFEHHVLTWNNVVVENRNGDGLHITMPTYGHPLDDQCAERYRRLGATVSKLPNCMMLAAFRGAAHCVTKDVAREPVVDQAALS